MQLAKRDPGGMEIGAVAMGFCNLQGNAVDPAAHEYAPSGKEQRRRDAELSGDRQGPAFTREEVTGDREAPPGHLVDPAQHRLDLARRRGETAALDGREGVAFEHQAARPAALELARRQRHSAAAAWAPSSQCSRSASARRVSVRFFSNVFSVPRSRRPLSLLTACASGGKRPKLTFIGWYERVPVGAALGSVSIWPPVICASNAPCAVVGGGGMRYSASRSAAANRPAISPMAADST